MSATDITYIGELVTDASQNRNGYNITRSFVYTSKEAITGYEILKQPEIPLLEQEHPDIPNLRVINISTSHETDHKGEKWIVTAEYSAETDNDVTSATFQTQLQPTDMSDRAPWDLPPTNISFEPVYYNDPFTYGYKDADQQFNPSVNVVNTAGDRFFDVPYTKKINILVKFTYNARKFDPQWLRLYLGTVNKERISILGIDAQPKTARINKLSSSYNRVLADTGFTDITKSYYRVDIEIEIAVGKDFEITLINNGFNVLVGGKKSPIYVATDSSDNVTYISKNALDLLDDTDIRKKTATRLSDPVMLSENGTSVVTDDVETVTFEEAFASDWQSLSIPSKSPESYF